MSDGPRLPQPREVWSVCGEDVVLNDENADKAARFVLVVLLRDLIVDHTSIFNAIPLSATAKPDRLSIPIFRSYEDIAQGFDVKNTSCAIVNLYQPIRFNAYKKYKGRIDETTYEMIKTTLCKEVVGYNDFDYNA